MLNPNTKSSGFAEKLPGRIFLRLTEGGLGVPSPKTETLPKGCAKMLASTGRRCIGWARSACKPQEVNGVNQQMDVLRRYAAEHGLTLVEEIRLEGVSGHDSHAALDRLANRKIEVDDFDVLLAVDLSRFTRGGFQHFARLIDKLTKAGVVVVTVQNGPVSPMCADATFIELKGWRNGDKETGGHQSDVPPDDPRRRGEIQQGCKGLAETTGQQRNREEASHP